MGGVFLFCTPRGREAAGVRVSPGCPWHCLGPQTPGVVQGPLPPQQGTPAAVQTRGLETPGQRSKARLLCAPTWRMSERPWGPQAAASSWRR